MKFEVTTDRVRTLVRADPGESDGYPPLPRLEIGTSLASISSDRIAVGLTLIYCRQISALAEFPREISALTARRVQEFFGARYVSATPVRRGALPIPKGSLTVRVFGPGPTRTSVNAEKISSLTLDSLTHRDGISYSGTDVSIASNIALFAPPPEFVNVAKLHELGLAVLLAEHVDASVLVHESGDAQNVVLTQLLECVGLGLVQP